MRIISLGNPPTPYIYEEGMHYNWDKTGNVLQLFLTNPSPREINTILTGDVAFNLVTYPECLFLLIQFEGMPWWDAPYSWWVVPENQRTQPPELAEDESLLMFIFLINACNGNLEVERPIITPKPFAEALIKAVEEQMQNPIDSTQYNQRIDEVYNTYSFSAQMLENALLR
jgi:hypothetical protein